MGTPVRRRNRKNKEKEVEDQPKNQQYKRKNSRAKMYLTREELSSLLLFTVISEDWAREVHRFTSLRKKKSSYVQFRNKCNKKLNSLEELKEELGANFLDFVEFKTAYSHDIVSNKVGANSRARKAAKLWIAGNAEIDTSVKEAMLKASEVTQSEEPIVEPLKETASTDDSMSLSNKEAPSSAKEQEVEKIETELEIPDNKETETEDIEIIEEEEIVEKCATEDIPEEEAQIESIPATNTDEIEEIEAEDAKPDEKTAIENLEKAM